jgi:hypothetical protein
MLTLFETARRDINRNAVITAIADCFRADHNPVEEPLPERLASLLEQVEQAISVPSGQREHIRSY